MELSYGEWAVIGLSVIMTAILAVIGKTQNIPALLVSLISSLVIFYIAYRIIRRFYPKSGHWGLVQWTITIFLLGVVIVVILFIIIFLILVVVGFGILGASGVLPSVLPGVPLPGTSPKTVDALGAFWKTETRNGFTFSYPEGSRIMDVAGVFGGQSDTAATAQTGSLLITSGQDLITLLWFANPGEPEGLDEMFQSMATQKYRDLDGASNVTMGSIQHGMHQGHMAGYLPVRYQLNGVPYSGALTWWYCPQTQRVFGAFIDSPRDEQAAIQIINRFTIALQCHT
ncbi:MAG: hypothetical protein LUQ64_04050 [Methanomicrobiales archaeon]|nr:hypothetical protein [Methanomicrobiales archaeon]